MVDVIIIRDLIKIMFVCIFSFFTYLKITQGKKEIKFWILVVIESIIVSLIYVFLNKYLSSILTFLSAIILYMILLRTVIKDKITLYILGYMFSVVIVYLIYLVSTFIIAISLTVVTWEEKYNKAWFIIPIILLASIFNISIFKMKRFKKGFNFLKNENVNKKVLVFIFVILFIVLIVFGLTKSKITSLQQNLILVAILVITVALAVTIRKLITQYYKKHMRDRTIEMQKREIDEHLQTLEHVKAENIRLATIIHKYNSRISALEKGITKAMSSMNTEFAGELAVMLDETQAVSRELDEQTKRNVNIPTTNIFGIDNMFQHMNDECIENNINFTLKITDSITYLVENVVKKEKLETLIGDHIKDAIIAINSGESEYRSILCVLGIVRDSYEFSVYDTGIDFGIDTLIKLGKEQVTTHKDTGGSGIGFMTTFETMKECGASLVIEEYDKKTTHYSKSVTIRFDGKNEYRIYSYRHKEIKKACKDKRIIIDKIE